MSTLSKRGIINAPIWAPNAAAASAGATIGYWGYKAYKYYKGTDVDSSFEINVIEKSKKGGIDPYLPKNPAKNKNWEEIRLDKAKPDDFGHKTHDHYHRPNPNKTGDHDAYLDTDGRPVPNGSDASHLYPPEWVWW